MQWIKVSDRLPEFKGSYFCKLENGTGSIGFHSNYFNTPLEWDCLGKVEEWLDESAPSFSLKDMLDAYNQGAGGVHAALILNNFSYKIGSWFIDKYGIDINKK